MTFGLEKFIASSELIRFIVFNVLAVIRTILDFILWRVLVWIFQPNLNFIKFLETKKINRFALAQIISFIISTIISYYANKYITFADDTPTSIYSIIMFSFVSLVALIASVIVIEFLTGNKKILLKVVNYKLINKYWPTISKLAIIVITLFINYFGQKYLVFTNISF